MVRKTIPDAVLLSAFTSTMIFPLAMLSVLVAYIARGAELEPYVPHDLSCPPGSVSGFVQNNFAYVAPLRNFTNITHSFFDIVWYFGSVVTNTTGRDNVPGATRFGHGAGGTFNETLIMYFNNPDAYVFALHGQPATFPMSHSPQATKLDGYVETMRFLSICGGKATYIDVITYYCHDSDEQQQIAAYDLLYTAHTLTFEKMAAGLGAPVFAGVCPANKA
ncbi:hypothetical protein R3P38DRAFT_1556832 [Favolaschia claudopus]|uniref:Uncharacterized protein n=1 Tax=Favolaschia claudopus TaxID=2862362 RepID=A0AAW0AJC8_9AGAR